jgi:hypothetical protein
VFATVFLTRRPSGNSGALLAQPSIVEFDLRNLHPCPSNLSAKAPAAFFAYNRSATRNGAGNDPDAKGRCDWCGALLPLGVSVLELLVIACSDCNGAERGNVSGIAVVRYPAGAVHIYAVPVVRPIFAAVVEEIGFRGILQGGLEQHMRRWQAIAITTVVFVWAHSGTAWFVPEFLFYIALSVYCGLLASRTQSVLPAMLLHLVVNVIGILAPLVWGPIHLRKTPDMVVIPLFFVALTCIYLFRKVATSIPTTPGTLELTP